MKNKLSICIILSLCSPVHAQSYQPIPADSVYWVEVESGSDGENCTYYTYRYIYPIGNVVIQGNNYTEYRMNGITEFVPSIPPFTCSFNQTFTDQFYVFIRNDSINQKVYVYDTLNLHQDILIYDFNLTTGDTVNPTSSICACNTVCPFDTFVVGNIDSVDVGGIYLKRFEILKITDPLADTVAYIQGVGSNFGLAYNYYCPVEISTRLVCYHYKNYDFTPFEYVGSPYCTQTLSVNQLTSDFSTILVPYTGRSFYINNEQNDLIQISCFNMLGEITIQKTYNESGILNFDSLATGIYVLYIIDNGKVLKPYKFLISN